MAKIDLRKLTKAAKEKYQIADNTFSYKPKDIVNDRVEVEIGDAKTPGDFLPQLKIKRWDNEVNFSLRLKDDSAEPEVVNLEGAKIKWSKGKLEAHFYDKPDASENGGSEFEVILKEKPKTNILQFSIETKGLVFSKQEQLTESQLAKGLSRPENAINSYAVYYKNCPTNYEGGKEYKTGKAFHIYRIKATDANGVSVWGNQNIDVDKKLHTIELPQEFLDSAVYPVLVDPTFGYTSVGVSDYDLGATVGQYVFNVATPSSSGIMTKLSGRFGTWTTGKKVKGEAYEGDASGNTLLSTKTNEVTSGTANAWNDFTFTSGIAVTASEPMILVLRGNSSTINIKWDTVSGVIGFGEYTYADDFPESIDAEFFIDGYQISLYATYTVVPTVTTQAASSITKNGATGNGNITATGGANATKRGVVYGTTSKSAPGNVAPASSGYDSYAEDTGDYGTGAFTKAVTGLSDGQVYYMRAYAYNSAGYAYGDQVSFTTINVTDISKTAAYRVKTTPTAPTKALAYAVITIPAITKGLVYAVKAEIGATKGLVYAVKIEEATTKTLEYRVKSTPADIEKALAYAVKAEAAATKTAEYRVKTIAAATKTLAYEVKSPVAITKSLAYGVITTAALTKALSYSIKKPQAITKGLVYAIHTIPAVEKDLAYSVKTVVGIAKGLEYSIPGKAAHEITKDLGYFIIIPTAQTKGLEYSVKAGASQTKALVYCVKAEAATTKALAYAVKTTPAANTKDLVYKVKVAQATTKTLAYSVRTYAGIEKGLEYTIKGGTAKTLELAYTVKSDVGVTKGQVYAIRTQGAQSKALAYEVKTAAGLTKGLKYCVKTPAATTLALAYEVVTNAAITKAQAYKVKAPQAKTLSLGYVVESQAAITKSLVYVLVGRQAIIKGLAYRVQTSAAKTKALEYAVQTEGAISKSLRYYVYGYGSISKTLEYSVTAEIGITKALAYVVRIRPYTKKTSPYVHKIIIFVRKASPYTPF